MTHKKGFGMPFPMGFNKSQVEVLDDQVDIVNEKIAGRRPSNTSSQI